MVAVLTSIFILMVHEVVSIEIFPPRFVLLYQAHLPWNFIIVAASKGLAPIPWTFVEALPPFSFMHVREKCFVFSLVSSVNELVRFLKTECIVMSYFWTPLSIHRSTRCTFETSFLSFRCSIAIQYRRFVSRILSHLLSISSRPGHIPIGLFSVGGTGASPHSRFGSRNYLYVLVRTMYAYSIHFLPISAFFKGVRLLFVSRSHAMLMHYCIVILLIDLQLVQYRVVAVQVLQTFTTTVLLFVVSLCRASVFFLGRDSPGQPQLHRQRRGSCPLYSDIAVVDHQQVGADTSPLY